MRTSVLLLAGSSLLSLGSIASASTLALWTFETNTPADLSDSASGPAVLAESGNGTLQGVHSKSTSDWSTPAGAASANSYSATDWTAGDYFQFSTSSLGYENVVVSFDATGSNTGPKNFKIAYSTDGSSFTDLAGGSYSLVNVTTTWSSSIPANAHFSFDFSAIAALDNDSSIYFRLIQVGTTSINDGTVGTAGTSRIDNVTVTASAIPVQSVPLPAAAFAGPALLGLLAVARRRGGRS